MTNSGSSLAAATQMASDERSGPSSGRRGKSGLYTEFARAEVRAPAHQTRCSVITVSRGSRVANLGGGCASGQPVAQPATPISPRSLLERSGYPGRTKVGGKQRVRARRVGWPALAWMAPPEAVT